MTDDEPDDRPDAFEESDRDESTDADDAAEGIDPTDSADGDSEEAPLDDLARRVRESREGRTDEDLGLDETDLGDADFDLPEDDDLFESIDVADVDAEAVWEAFVEGDTDPEDHLGVGVEATTVDPQAHEHVVPKREYCQRCPHFTEPPATACTHEGTTILEVVDDDRFRVRNCPMVEEDGSKPTFK